MTTEETDILVVGAGPCGLMLANELGRRGVRTIVVDRKSEVSSASQANATQARSMEHFRRLGFSSELRKQGLPGDYPTDVAYFTTYAGYELARHRMPSSNDADAFIRANEHIWNGPEMPHRIAQSRVERVLHEHAHVLSGVDLRFNRELVDFHDTGDIVTARIRDLQSGAEHHIAARFLFGADGSQSTVRKKLGIRYRGGDIRPRDFMGGRMLAVYLEAPEFYNHAAGANAWMYWSFNTRRRALLAAIDGKGQFVLQTQLRPGEDPDAISDVDAGKLFLQAVGADIPFKVTGVASWLAGRALVADEFKIGRVLLGGDAVHLFTPTGGMGYNTAVDDSANAGWKLAAVINGLAAPALLDSYEAERRPVAIRNTDYALKFADSVGLYRPTAAIEEEGFAGEAARKRAGTYLGQHAAREFTIPGLSLGARYDGSPAIIDEDSPLPPDDPCVYVPSAKPGGRAPHVWLADGTSLFDRFGFDWTLLSFCPDKCGVDTFRSEAAKRRLRLAVVDLSEHPIARDLYRDSLVLIRPDQIVAWRGPDPAAKAAAQIFDRLLGIPRTPQPSADGSVHPTANSDLKLRGGK